VIEVAPEVVLLRGFAAATAEYAAAVDVVAAAAPFRHLQTPGGRSMSAAMTNCGALGWHSDARGYRYERRDPLSGLPWPAMPSIFLELAQRAAAKVGYRDFLPDACLINRYEGKAKMGAHRDADEREFSQPIVSVTLGAAATFLWYGPLRSGPAVKTRLEPTDVLVWGGAARRGYHAVGQAEGAAAGAVRINLTFRKAG
jgi:alkylated DNA repair protein (DNA oxidative demethylase)